MKCLIFAEFSKTGGTRSFLIDLLAIHYSHHISTEVVFPFSDPEICSYIESLNFSYTIVPERKPIFKKSYFSLLYEFYYYSKIISKAQPDLIVVSSATPGENIFCFLSKIPSIYILHTPVQQTTTKNRLMLQIPALFSGAKKRIYTVSDFVKKSVLQNWQVKEEDVAVIYNSYRLDTSLTNSPVSNRVVLTLGHVIDYKNPLLWLKIAHQVNDAIPDVEFIWLGDGNMLSYMQELTKDAERINFVGHKSNIEAYYQKAYLYLQPSLKESLGISVLDAMSMGIPTIVSNVEGLPETTKHMITGFICVENNANEYVEYITTLLNDEKLRNTMGAEAQRRACDVFSPKIQEKAILSLYSCITSDNS